MLIRRCLLYLSAAAVICAQTPAAATDPNKVVASVDGKDITVGDIQKMLDEKQPGFAQMYQQRPQDAVSRYLLLQFLTEEAAKRDLENKSPFKEQLDLIRKQTLAQFVIDDERNDFSVTAADIDAYYAEHKAEYEQAKVKVIYIRFKVETATKANTQAALEAAARQALGGVQPVRSEAEARQLAEEIVKKLRAGADFVELVKQYSEDSASKSANGDYGVVKQGSAYPADFVKAVLALKDGEISDPIRQPSALYIVRVEERKAQPIGELRDTIMDTIRNNHFNEWMKGVTSRFQLQVKDPDFFKNVSVPGVPPPLLSAPQGAPREAPKPAQ
jgi:peptidyl-prolyl cis-trans isomerase C